jgi:hypothetical protein
MWILWQDLQYSARLLRKHPGFTLTAVGVLTLGIGVNAGIFGIINGLTSSSRPFVSMGRTSPLVRLLACMACARTWSRVARESLACAWPSARRPLTCGASSSAKPSRRPWSDSRLASASPCCSAGNCVERSTRSARSIGQSGSRHGNPCALVARGGNHSGSTGCLPMTALRNE